jgi:hypothetical protein
LSGNHGENYVLVGVNRDASVVLLSERMTDGSRAVIVFSDEVGAEAFRIVEKLGPRVQIVADAPQEVARLLEAAAATGGARYVAIDPPTSLTRGNVDSRLVPLSGFLDHLLGE